MYNYANAMPMLRVNRKFIGILAGAFYGLLHRSIEQMQGKGCQDKENRKRKAHGLAYILQKKMWIKSPLLSEVKKTKKNFSNRFYFFPQFELHICNCSNELDLRNLQDQVKEAFCFKNCSYPSLFEKIILVSSKFLQLLGLQPRISKVFLDH